MIGIISKESKSTASFNIFSDYLPLTTMVLWSPKINISRYVIGSGKCIYEFYFILLIVCSFACHAMWLVGFLKIVCLWLRSIVVAVPASPSCGSRHSRCGGVSCRAQAVEHAGFSSRGSWAVGHRLRGCGPRLSCPVACAISPDQGSNLYSPNWQGDS